MRSVNECGRNFDARVGGRGVEVQVNESKPERMATYADDEDFPRRVLIFHVS